MTLWSLATRWVSADLSITSGTGVFYLYQSLSNTFFCAHYHHLSSMSVIYFSSMTHTPTYLPSAWVVLTPSIIMSMNTSPRIHLLIGSCLHRDYLIVKKILIWNRWRESAYPMSHFRRWLGTEKRHWSRHGYYKTALLLYFIFISPKTSLCMCAYI